MSQRFYGSICVTDIVEFAHKKHSSYTKADNGKIYANVTVWLNDDVDKFGNIMSVQLNPKKDLREQDGSPYIGNMKEAEAKPITQKDTSGLSLPTDISSTEKGLNTQKEPEDLPF